MKIKIKNVISLAALFNIAIMMKQTHLLAMQKKNQDAYL